MIAIPQLAGFRETCLLGSRAFATLACSALFASAAFGQNASSTVKGAIEYGYWGNAKRTELTEAVSRAFEAAYPGTKVSSVVAEYQSYIERLTVQAAAGELPCVTQLQNLFLATYASRGVLRPLDDLVKSGAIDVSGIPDAVLESGRIDGKLYMIPTGTFVRLNAFNAGMAKQYGIPEPAKRINFVEYRNWLIAAQQKLPKGTFAVEADGAWLFTFDNWVAGHGEALFKGKTFGFKPETLTQYLTYWKDLKDAGVVLPTDRLDEQFSAQELRPLSRGRVLSGTRDIPGAAQISQTLASANLPSEIKFFRNPAIQGAKSGNVPGANGLAISASCKNASTAAAYINFFSNDAKAAMAFQSANGVVVSKTGRQALLANALTPAAVRSSIEILSTVIADNDISPAPSYRPGYQALQDPLRRAYEAVTSRGVDPAEAAKQFLSEAARTIR